MSMLAWIEGFINSSDAPLFVIYLSCVFIGLFTSKWLKNKRMAASQPRRTNTTVEGLRTLIKDTLPHSQDKKKKPKDLKPNLLFINRDFSYACPVNRYDEVFPGIFIGDQYLAFQKPEMVRLGITHVLNAAQGEKFSQIDTTEAYYADINVKFYGIKAMDSAKCKLSQHFDEAANFIDDALKSGGKVFVHCFQGISRSATLVLVYLMIHRNHRVEDAITMVRQKRAVFPNDGFLKQLVELNEQLASKRSKRRKESEGDTGAHQGASGGMIAS